MKCRQNSLLNYSWVLSHEWYGKGDCIIKVEGPDPWMEGKLTEDDRIGVMPYGLDPHREFFEIIGKNLDKCPDWLKQYWHDIDQKKR